MLKIALLLVKNIFFDVKKGISRLVSQVAPKHTAQEQIKELKREVTNQKSSFEHTDADLNNLSGCVDEIFNYQVDPEYMTNKLIDLEDKTKRNNLRIYGNQSQETKLGRNVKRKYRKYLTKSLVLKMFKMKEHIAQRGAKVITIVTNQQQQYVSS